MPPQSAIRAKRRSQANWRKKDQAVHGIEQVNVRVPARRKQRVKTFAERLRMGDLPRVAFKAAFPDGYAAILRADAEGKRERRAKRGKEEAAPLAASSRTYRKKPTGRDRSAGR